jgi:hypothetical protein
MSVVLDFNKRLKEREEQAELNKLRGFFRELLAYATPAEKEAIKTALETKNETAYQTVTSPIIMRMSLDKANRL